MQTKIPKIEVEVDHRSRRAALSVLVLMGAMAGSMWYFAIPHPRPRSVVQYRGEYITTVDGVTRDGWLTECETGNRRHIVGDYLLSDGTVPVVCFGEAHYQEWLKDKARRNAQQ